MSKQVDIYEINDQSNYGDLRYCMEQQAAGMNAATANQVIHGLSAQANVWRSLKPQFHPASRIQIRQFKRNWLGKVREVVSVIPDHWL